MKHLPLGILITLFSLLGYCTPLQAQNSDTTSNVDCPPITSPWEENFDTVPAVSYDAANGRLPNCWCGYWNGTSVNLTPHVVNDYDRYEYHIRPYVQNNNALLLQAGSSVGGYDSIAIVETPSFGVPLAGNKFSFYCMFESTHSGRFSVGYMQNGSFVSIAEIEPQTTGRTEYMRLDGMPADVDRIAFRWNCLSGYWHGVILDNIRVYDYNIPDVRLASNWTSYTGVVTTIDAQFVGGSIDGLRFSWHSSLMDTTIVTMDSILNILYNVGGYDTITLVVTNAYGSDTASAVVDVIDCPPITLPWEENFGTIPAVNYNTANGKLPNCWHSYWNGSNGNLAPHVINNYLQRTRIQSYAQNSNALLLLAGTSDGYDSIAIVETPAFGVPLAGNNLLSFYCMYEDNRGQLSVGYMQNDSFVSIAEIEPQDSGRIEYVMLDGMPADVDRIAFKWRYVGNDWYGVILDNIRVYDPIMPMVHFASNWTSYTGVSTTISAQLVEGSTEGLSFSWHSSLMDTTIVTMDSILNLFYNVGGYDTITLVVTNAFGSTTVSAVVDVFNCTTIDSLPWTEDFNTTSAVSYNAVNGRLANCWQSYWNGTNDNFAPHVVNNYFQYTNIWSYVRDNRALLLQAGTSVGYDSISFVETPAFGMPLAGKLLSFYCMIDLYGQLSVGYMQNGGFVSLAEIEPQTSGRTEYVMLDGMPADANRIAFKWRHLGGDRYGVILDNIRVAEPDSLPMVRLALNHWVAYASDTTTFSAQLLDGSTDNLRFSWHSSLMDTTIVTMDPVLSIAYNAGGCDTLTLVATNAYGSDTALAVVTAIDCPPIDSLPWTEDFNTTPAVNYNAPNGKLPNCWYGYWIGAKAVYAPHVVPTDGYQFVGTLPSPALLMMAGILSDYGTVEQVVLPRFSQPSQELAIAFDYSFEAIDRGTFTVGYLDRNNTFVAIADMTPHDRSYRRDTVLLGAIPYSNASIALRWQCSFGVFYAVSIDNIEVFEVPFTHTVTVSSNVDGICQPYGSGRYLDSSTVEIGYNILDTIAEGGYWRFQGWSDGGTGNPRQILVVSDTTIVSLFEWVPTQGISNVSTQSINIYPNPASGKVTIELGSTSATTVSLIDMNGRTLSSFSYQTPSFSFDVSTLPSGIYFVKVASQTGIAISKLVVKH